MGSNLLLVDSSSQLSNLTGFALVFERRPLPSPGSRHVDMHENPVSADPGLVTTQNSPLRKIFTQAGEKGHILISAACPACRHHGSPMAVPDCYPPVHLPHLEFSAVPELMSLRALSAARCQASCAQLTLGSPPGVAGPGEARPPPLFTCRGLGLPHGCCPPRFYAFLLLHLVSMRFFLTGNPRLLPFLNSVSAQPATLGTPSTVTGSHSVWPTWQGVGFLPHLTHNSTDFLLWGGWGS